jgi:hypothetical protein
MKNCFLIFLGILVLVVTSCKKDDFEPTPSIVGTWELKTGISGMTGKSTDYPSGNGSILKFTDSSFEIYFDHKLVNSGSYKVVSDTSGLTQEKANRIVYNDQKDVRNFFNLKEGKLNMWIDAYDAPSSIFIKISN